MVLLVLGLAVSAGPAWAQDAEPDPLAQLRPILTKNEAALLQAATDLKGGVQTTVVTKLRQLSMDNAGTETSGLARILVAKSSLALGRYDDAAEAARHPDIDRTTLGDRALLILAQAKARAGDFAAAASAYLRAVDAAGADDVRCSARLGAAAALKQIKQNARRVALLTEATEVCRQDHADVLLDLATALVAESEADLALPWLEEIERAYPTSPQARNAAIMIARILGPHGSHPQRSARQDFERRLARAQALLERNQRTAAVAELRKLKIHKGVEGSLDQVQVALGRALSRSASREARALLNAVPDTSLLYGEAQLQLARLTPEAQRPVNLQAVVDAFPGTVAAEEALYSLATFFQKDALYSEAAPYYRRLVDEFADGSYAEGAAMRAAFEAIRSGRTADAAAPLETMARRARYPAGFLYWAGMARLRNGETERATVLLAETAHRFRNSWYGNLAEGELKKLPQAAAQTATVTGPDVSRPDEDLPGAFKARLRELLLVGLETDALDELRAMGNTRPALEARALIEASRGELRNAIIYMKRARPEYVAAETKDLPSYVWTTIYPLKHDAALRKAAAREKLDPALVAALVCQESTFDEKARSVAGARGLMQIMPYTGRPLARELGMRYTTQMLHIPETSLAFGTRYLRQMLDRFDSRPEAALAAYNAGPHRVVRWLAPNPQIRTDEFAESIPFTETRNYVMIVLGARDKYRKLYGLEPVAEPGS